MKPILEFGQKHPDAQYRKSVGAIIYNKKTDKVLALDWRIYPIYGIVQGGQEEPETEIQTLEREIVEETGYTDFSIEEKLGENIISYFYADIKKVWRKLELACYFVNLETENKKDQKLEVYENFDLKWISIQEFIDLVSSHSPTITHNFEGLKEFLERAKAHIS